jgi:ATP phosphoribosyltransferase
MKNRLTIAIQKNGRLSEQSIDLLKKSGINFSYKGDKLLAKSNNLPIDILFVRSDDIPSLVSNGDADLGYCWRKYFN